MKPTDLIQERCLVRRTAEQHPENYYGDCRSGE